MARTLLFSGFDLRAPELPTEARILRPPPPQPGLENPGAAFAHALQEPVAGPSLSSLLGQHARVAVVIDDLSYPVPQMARDCRREMLEALVLFLSDRGVRPGRVKIVVANGLSRKWRPAELDELIGSPATASWPIQSHDAEEGTALVRIGEEPEGPVEFNRALVEADVLVHLNVVTSPLAAGLFNVVSGATGYRTLRFLGAPQVLAREQAPLVPGSEYHRMHERVGAALRRRVPVFQLSVVLDNALWNPTLTSLFGGEGLGRPLQMWNALPAAVRHRAARLLKANYRPIAAFAGDPEGVAPRAREAFYGQHRVSVDAPADVLVFGLPDVGPATVGASTNPVLSTSLALGYVSNLFTDKPLVREGGVIVFANPMTPTFDRKVHLAHEEFYEKVLRIEREPEAIHERFEPYFAGRPEFVSNYQRRHAFHGTHPLYGWYLGHAARRRAGKIVVAHGDPRACTRFGFTHSVDVEDALDKARNFLGEPSPKITVLALPPPFWSKVC